MAKECGTLSRTVAAINNFSIDLQLLDVEVDSIWRKPKGKVSTDNHFIDVRCVEKSH